MKFPSIQQVLNSALGTARRFPFELLFSLSATVIGILMIGLDYTESNYRLRDTYVHLLMICNIGLAFHIAFSLYAENTAMANSRRWTGRVAILGLLALIYWQLSGSTEPAMMLHFVLWALIAHLMVAFLPFWRNGNLNGFWQYNKLLFLRFCTAVLYSGVLYAGLSVALLASDNLFNLDLDGNIYGQLWFIIAGVFNTTFFLAGIPASLASLNEVNEYPKALKIFTQFVLIPLASIYLAILLAYEVKILLQFELPEGTVAALILGYAVFGMLSILLVHPIRNEEGNRWIYLFSRSFYLLMIPLIILLVLAIWKRVADYGITEERYFLMLLAVWLIFITAYFLWGRKDNIKMIPVSLCLLALLAVYGPQSAFSVSARSQGARLEKFIAGKSADREKEIHNIVNYFVRVHGVQSLQPFVKADIEAIQAYYRKKIGTKTQWNRYSERNVDWDTRDSILRSIGRGLDKFDPYTGPDNALDFSFAAERSGIIETDGPAMIVEFDSDTYNERKFTWKEKKWTLVAAKDRNGISFSSDFKTETYDLRGLFRRLVSLKGNKNVFLVDEAPVRDTITVHGSRIILRVNNIEGNFTDSTRKEVNINNFKGYAIFQK